MNNIIAEKEIIGSLLIDKDCLVKIIDKINKDDFTDLRNQNIYIKIIDHYMSNKPYDLVSLISDSKMPKDYLIEIQENTATSANIEHFCDIVKECSKKRVLTSLLSSSLNDIKESECASTIFKIESNLASMGRDIKRNNKDMATTSNEFLEHLTEIHESKKSGKQFLGIESGYIDLDRILNGLNKSHLIVVAGLTSAGKSAFVTNIAYNVSKFNNVYFISTEMGTNEIMGRLFMIQSGYSTDNFYQSGGASEKAWVGATTSIGLLSSLKLILNDKAYTLENIYSNLKILKKNNKLDLCIIDYLQHIKGEGDNRETQISHVSRTLKRYSQEFEIPIIAVSQYNRGGYNSEVPTMSNLRGSGAIEQDANSVINLYKDKEDNLINLFIEKNRSGRVGNIQLFFNRENLKFSNLEKKHE